MVLHERKLWNYAKYAYYGTSPIPILWHFTNTNTMVLHQYQYYGASPIPIPMAKYNSIGNGEVIGIGEVNYLAFM